MAARIATKDIITLRGSAAIVSEFFGMFDPYFISLIFPKILLFLNSLVVLVKLYLTFVFPANSLQVMQPTGAEIKYSVFPFFLGWGLECRIFDAKFFFFFFFPFVLAFF